MVNVVVSVAPEEQMARSMSCQLATAPVNWNNSDLENWRPAVPFPEILDRARSAGYAAMEFGEEFGDNAEQIARAARERQMRWCGAYRWIDTQSRTPDETVSDLDSTFRLLEAIDCGNLIVSDRLRPERTAIAGRANLFPSIAWTDDQFAAVAITFLAIRDAAAKHDIRVWYHPHVGTYIETGDEIASFLDALGPNRGAVLCFDTGHFAYAGGNSLTFLRSHISDVGYLHLKDVDTTIIDKARAEEWSFQDALRHVVFAEIGHGAADVPAIIRLLETTGFGGWIVIEQDTCAGDSTETAKRNRDAVLAMMEIAHSSMECAP